MKKWLLCWVVVITIGGTYWARSGHSNNQWSPEAEPVSRSHGWIPSCVEQKIPFDIRVTSAPTERCDPLTLEVIFTIGEGGRELDARWRVMDGDSVQMESSSFDEIYYRCDLPGCFLIRAVEINALNEKIISDTTRHVCLK